MAVEQRVGPHTALQIDRIADTEPPEIRFEQRLADRRGRVPVALDRYDRQADPVMGDALIDFQFVRERAFEREMPVPAFFADRGDAGCGFDYSRKHGLLLVFMSSGANRFGKSLRTLPTKKLQILLHDNALYDEQLDDIGLADDDRIVLLRIGGQQQQLGGVAPGPYRADALELLGHYQVGLAGHDRLDIPALENHDRSGRDLGSMGRPDVLGGDIAVVEYRNADVKLRRGQDRLVDGPPEYPCRNRGRLPEKQRPLPARRTSRLRRSEATPCSPKDTWW